MSYMSCAVIAPIIMKFQPYNLYFFKPIFSLLKIIECMLGRIR